MLKRVLGTLTHLFVVQPYVRQYDKCVTHRLSFEVCKSNLLAGKKNILFLLWLTYYVRVCIGKLQNSQSGSTNNESKITVSSLVSVPPPKKSYSECAFRVLSLSSKGGNPHVITFTTRWEYTFRRGRVGQRTYFKNWDENEHLHNLLNLFKCLSETWVTMFCHRGDPIHDLVLYSFI